MVRHRTVESATDSMPSGVKKKTEKKGKNSSMTMGDAELAVRFLQDGDSSDDNTDEQLKVSYRQCKLCYFLILQDLHVHGLILHV